MFKLFKKQQNVQEVIEEIHNAFDTSTERLLNEAKSIIEKENKVDYEKASRLEKLGFHKSKHVTESKEQREIINERKRLAEKIMYYQQWYPNNKFITEKEVKRICEKYFLVFGEVKYYKGTVPDKNLSEIESFKLRDEDMEDEYRTEYPSADYNDYMRQEILSQQRRALSGLGDYFGLENIQRPIYNVTNKKTGRKIKSDFMICAPKADFDTTTMIVSNNYKLEHIPDPIVLQPVKEGYLVVSKWGLEASDEIVVNEKLN